MLRPRETQGVRIASSELTISPTYQLRWQRDALDNAVAVVGFSVPSAGLRIASQVIIESYDEAPFDFLVEDYAVRYPFSYQPEEAAVLAPLRSPAWPEDSDVIADWLRGLSLGGSSETFALLFELNRIVNRSFRYEMREQPGVQSPVLTLSRKSGSCRDLAALFVEATRHLGFASRFVSGYNTNYASDFGGGSTHAWAEVYVPGPGWKGFDPTAGIVTGSDHIAVAVARHPETVPPVAGSYIGPTETSPTLLVSVRVVPIQPA
jgi:transglutaminase-like putative cysteine protease